MTEDKTSDQENTFAEKMLDQGSAQQGNKAAFYQIKIAPNRRYRLISNDLNFFSIGKGEMIILQAGDHFVYRKGPDGKRERFGFKDYCDAQFEDWIYVSAKDDIEIANISNEDAFVVYLEENPPSIIKFPWRITSKDDIQNERGQGHLDLAPIDELEEQIKIAAAKFSELLASDDNFAKVVFKLISDNQLEVFIKNVFAQQASQLSVRSADTWGPHVPARAPRLWKERDKRAEKSPADFIRKEYSEWMPYLANRDLLHLDRPLYFRYAEWKGNTDDLDQHVKFGVAGQLDDAERGRRARETNTLSKAKYRARKRVERDIVTHPGPPFPENV